MLTSHSTVDPIRATKRSVTIRPVETPADRRAFMRVASAVYADDPNFVVPLEFELSARLDPTKNPTLKNADHQLWIAEIDGAAVGRISAIINPLHLDRYHDDTGHFGFLDAIDDADVFDALISTAEKWLADRSMKKIAGPFSFSVNEECGMLIDGFNAPPYVMMPHGRTWYQAHIERRGYTKAVDMYALRYPNERQFIPERRQRFIDKLISSPKVSIRLLDTKKFRQDIGIVVDIYNDAWADNHGFIPFSTDQADQMASELRPIIEPHNLVICYYEDAPAAFGLVLPNINEAIRGFNGKLLPFNWAKFLWRLKVQKLTSARMPLMGIRKKLQGKPMGAAFAYKIIDMVNSANIDRGVVESELSWILETNPAMLNMLTDMGGQAYKTYRIYERPL